jgi:alpha-1,3-rhamnosyl/mannosyltransferase
MRQKAAPGPTPAPLRVAVDGRSLHDPHSQQRGIGRYLGGLTAALAERADIDLAVLVPAGVRLPAGAERVEVRRLVPQRSRVFQYRIGLLGLQEHRRRLPGEISRAGAEVFHSPAMEPPQSSPIPWVQTVHDATPMVDARSSAAEAEAWLRRMTSIRQADAVVAVSTATAEDIKRVLGIDPGRLHVIPSGVDPRFSPRAEGPPDRSDGFLLSVGPWAPNKGYPEAMELIGRLARRGRRHHLKVAGTIKDENRPRLTDLVSGSPAPDRVELLGYVPDEELASLYRRASAVVVTSRYEGFGLPAVEAMASGTPVVAFDNSSLPEVIGEAGVLVPDGDVDAMVDAVDRLLEDTAAWSEMAQRGLRRAGEFSWERAASRYARVFRAVAAGTPAAAALD